MFFEYSIINSKNWNSLFFELISFEKSEIACFFSFFSSEKLKMLVCGAYLIRKTSNSLFFEAYLNWKNLSGKPGCFWAYLVRKNWNCLIFFLAYFVRNGWNCLFLSLFSSQKFKVLVFWIYLIQKNWNCLFFGLFSSEKLKLVVFGVYLIRRNRNCLFFEFI